MEYVLQIEQDLKDLRQSYDALHAKLAGTEMDLTHRTSWMEHVSCALQELGLPTATLNQCVVDGDVQQTADSIRKLLSQPSATLEAREDECVAMHEDDPSTSTMPEDPTLVHTRASTPGHNVEAGMHRSGEPLARNPSTITSGHLPMPFNSSTCGHQVASWRSGAGGAATASTGSQERPMRRATSLMDGTPPDSPQMPGGTTTPGRRLGPGSGAEPDSPGLHLSPAAPPWPRTSAASTSAGLQPSPPPPLHRRDEDAGLDIRMTRLQQQRLCSGFAASAPLMEPDMPEQLLSPGPPPQPQPPPQQQQLSQQAVVRRGSLPILQTSSLSPSSSLDTAAAAAPATMRSASLGVPFAQKHAGGWRRATEAPIRGAFGSMPKVLEAPGPAQAQRARSSKSSGASGSGSRQELRMLEWPQPRPCSRQQELPRRRSSSSKDSLEEPWLLQQRLTLSRAWVASNGVERGGGGGGGGGGAMQPFWEGELPLQDAAAQQHWSGMLPPAAPLRPTVGPPADAGAAADSDELGHQRGPAHTATAPPGLHSWRGLGEADAFGELPPPRGWKSMPRPPQEPGRDPFGR